VLGMAGVAAHPVPGHVMALAGLVEAAPEVFVLHRLLVGSLPAAGLPALHPLGDALAHILRIGEEVDRARALQGFQRHDGRHQLHAVVGGFGLAAGELLLLALVDEERTPAAGARIARAGTVRIDRHAIRAHRARPYSTALTTRRWKASLRSYSSGSFGFTSAPGGTLSQSTRRVSMKRMAAPRHKTGSAATSASSRRRTRS